MFFFFCLTLVTWQNFLIFNSLLFAFFQRIKGNQIQKQLREEMDVLSDHVTSLNAHRETQTQLVRKQDEREKALQNTVVRSYD